MAGFFTCRGKFRMALGRVMNSAYKLEVIIKQEIGRGREVLVALIGAVTKRKGLYVRSHPHTQLHLELPFMPLSLLPESKD